MTKGSPTITIRLRGDLKANLAQAAREDGTTVTAIAERQISAWLRRRSLNAEVAAKLPLPNR